MTTGVGMEMSRARSAFPRCHASSVLKCASTSEASIFAIVSSYSAGSVGCHCAAREGRTSLGGTGIGLMTSAMLELGLVRGLRAQFWIYF
jgi:hypothetical protein